MITLSINRIFLQPESNKKYTYGVKVFIILTASPITQKLHKIVNYYRRGNLFYIIRISFDSLEYLIYVFNPKINTMQLQLNWS